MADTPIRFQLTDRQAAAALAIAELTPTGVALAPSPDVEAPHDELRAGEFLIGEKVLPALETTMQILAEPSVMVTVMASVVGDTEWRRLEIAGNAAGYVARAATDGGLDVMLLYTATAVAAVVDDFLDLTTFVSPSEPTEVALGAAGWAGLLPRPISVMPTVCEPNSTVRRRRRPN